MYLEDVDITETDIKEALKRPGDFGYHGDLDLFETWSIGPCILTRDSDLVEKANCESLLAMLEEIEDISEDYQITRCNHWGCGWVDHLSFRAVENDGKTPTKVFKVIKSFYDGLLDYPVADDSVLSRLEYEAAIECIESNSPYLDDDAPKNWKEEVFSYLWENNVYFEEGWVAREEIEKAVYNLGYLDVDSLTDSYGQVANYYITHGRYDELGEFIKDPEVVEGLKEEGLLQKVQDKLDSIVPENQLKLPFDK